MMDEEEFTLPPLLVTDDIIKGLKSGAILASEAGATLPGINQENQLTFLTQLCEAYVEKKLDVDHVLAAIAAAGLHDDIGTDVAEALWFCSCKVGLSSIKGAKDTYEHLAELAKELNKKGKVTKAQLMAQLESELLDACGFMRVSVVARDRRALTAAYYKQDKFNLLREQNEGYGKLLAELLSGGPLQPEHVPALEQQIKRYIGTFNLDPNRVCDLVLDAAEVELAHSLETQRSADTPGPIPVPAGLQLMSLVGADTPMLMLARKFLHYQQERPKITGDEKEEELTGPPPRSLYLLAACMIKCGQATLEQVLPYLGPAEELQAQFKATHKKLVIEIDEIGKTNLGAEGTSAATKKMMEKAAGGLDAAAKAFGFTNRPTDDEGPAARPGYGDPRGGNMPPPGVPMGLPPGRGGMGGYPPSGSGWAMGQQGMGGQYGAYGPRGGAPYLTGPMGGFPGGPGMGGMSGSGMGPAGGGGAGARGGSGGGAGQGMAPAGADAGATRYNIMPAEDLVLDARQYDKQLLDPKAGQLQLLVALMQVNAWDAAILMMQWLQDVMQVQVSSDRAASVALCVHVQQLLQPVYSVLYPQGPSYGSVLERFAERPSTARDKDKEIKLLVFSAEQRSAQPFGPALDPVTYQLLGFLGPYLYRDAGLMVMLLKVLRHEILFYGGMLRGEAQADIVDKVCAVLSDAVLPALSLHPANLGLAHMVWDVLAHMPFPFRAQVYHKTLRVMPAWVVTRAATNLALKSFKRVKQRIALPAEKDEDLYKAVVRAQQHLIAKVTHATPLQVTAEIVQWVMSTPNQVEPMAEVVKMRNRLTSDALTYQVLFMWDRLGSNKIKGDGTSEADFVQGISDLVGRAGVAHPWSSFDLSTILRYLASTMKAGDPMGILLLRTVLFRMSGIEGPASADPSSYQLICMGPSLTGYTKNIAYGRLSELQERGRMVLRKLLTTPRGQHDQQLLVPLIVLMAQHLDWTLYTLNTEHVKEVAELYDKISYTTQQYLMLLEQLLREKQLSLQHLAAVLPPVHELIRDYKVAPGIAWSMWRPVFQALQPVLAAQLAQRESSNLAALDWAAACSGAGTAATAGGGDGEEGEVEEGEAMQGVEGPGAAQAPEIIAAAEKAVADLALPVDLSTLLASVESLGPDMFENLTPQLYLSFWTMELADIYIPTLEYEEAMTFCNNAKPKYGEETRRKQKEIQELQTQLDLQSRGGRNENDAYIKRMRGQLEGAKETFEKNSVLLKKAEMYGPAIKQEWDKAVAQNTLSMKRLQAEKHLYVTEAKSLRVKLHAFVKFCLLPRLLRSAADAVFCHLFTLKLHELDVPNWPAGFFWDEAMVSLTNIIPTVTEKEAGYLAMFLGLALLKIQDWYNEPAKFKAECDQQTMRQSTVHSVRMSHDQFKKLFRKWQNGLQKGLLVCLEDSEQYYQRRNALIIISKLINADTRPNAPPMFPFYKAHHDDLLKVLTELHETETRPDLKYMVKTTMNTLDSRSQHCKDFPGLVGKAMIPTTRRIPQAGAGGKGAAAAGAGTRPPASPARQQQQRGGAAKPSTPPSASAAAAGGGGGSAAVKPSEDKQQQQKTAAAAAAGDDKPAGSGSGQLPKAVRKAPPGAAAAGVLKKAVEAAAGGAQAAAAAGSKQTQRPSGGGGPGEDEPPTKRPRTSIPAPIKGDKADKEGILPGSAAAAAGGGGGGGDKEGREASKADHKDGDGHGRSSKQQAGGRTASRPPSGSAVAAERAAGGSSSRAASPAGVGSPARGGERTAGGAGDRGGSRMGAGRDYHGRGDHGQAGSRDNTPQRHGGHSDDPHPKAAAAAAGEDRKEQHRSHKGERGDHEKSRDGSRDRTRDPSRGRGHHSPEQPKHKSGTAAAAGAGAAAAAAEDSNKDSGKKEKRGSRREGGRRADKEGKKDAKGAEDREDSHDSKRRRLNDGPAAAAADGASSREQRQQQHGSNDGGGGRDRGEANGHRTPAAAAAAAGGGGGISTRGSRSAEQQQQQHGEGREGREQRRDHPGEKEREKEKEKDRKGRGNKDGGEPTAEKPTRHERISFPGAREEKDSKSADKTPAQPSKRRQR